MTLFSKEHYELVEQFDKEFRHLRLDKEDKAMWARGHIYQNDAANELFLAYRKGVAYGMAVAA